MRQEAFMDSFIPEPNSGCWLWLGALNADGYGRHWDGARREGAHRTSWRIFNGDACGLFVLHKCDVRCCVNPDHLFLGTQIENIEDMVRKGRAKGDNRPGEKHPMHRLSDDDIRAIRSRRLSGALMKALAVEYGISRQHVGSIINRNTWSHIQ